LPAAGWSERVLRAYRAAMTAIASGTMAAIVLVMAVQVFYRYVLNDSLVWAEEICRYLLIVMTFILVGTAFERGEMAAVNFFVDSLPRRLRLALLLPVYLLMVAFLGVMAYYGYRFATFNSGAAMPAVDFILSSLTGRSVSHAVSMYWLYLLIPVGCLLLAVHFVFAALRFARAALAADTP
jgi:TRAP-type C4-dicarboxylate transport system permease small subunit